MQNSIVIVLGIMVLVSAYAEGVSSAEPPEGKRYTYKQKTDSASAQVMEIHFPEGHDAARKRVPGIIMFHGGGWGGGNRKQFRTLCHYFAGRGLVAATVSYTLAKGYTGKGSRKRVCITDAKSAIRWYKQHAKELGIDPERIIGGGGSAGGHISLLATTNPGLNNPNDPEGFDTTVAAYLLFNPALSAGDATDSEVDFLHHLKADLPPAIVFFGSKDTWMKNGWTPAYAKMQSLGIKSVDVRIAEGQAHAFFNKQPWRDLTIIAADRFLTTLGFLEGEPTLAVPGTGETLVKIGNPTKPIRPDMSNHDALPKAPRAQR